MPAALNFAGGLFYLGHGLLDRCDIFGTGDFHALPQGRFLGVPRVFPAADGRFYIVVHLATLQYDSLSGHGVALAECTINLTMCESVGGTMSGL